MSRAAAVAAEPVIDVAPPRATAADREARKRHLAPVPPPTRRPARGPFIAVLTLLLAVGLLMLLALNTALAQGSFVTYELQADNAALAAREQRLLQEVAVAESPQTLEKRAQKLGMVPAANPVFLRLSDGKVLGVPVPAAAPPKPKPKPRVVPAQPAAAPVQGAANAAAATKPAPVKPAATKPAATKPAATKPGTATTPKGNGQ
jgi:cell division protein FtsB